MDYYSIGLTIGFITVITGIVLGWGDNRKIIVFRDYNDLGLTFLVPASFVLIYLIFVNLLGGNPLYAQVIGGLISSCLMILVIINTYNDNKRNISCTLLSLATKMPLTIIWLINIFTLLNPSGKTARQRSQSRGTALIILTILTPIIAQLVVDRSGSYFNPKGWLKGRRGVSHIRNSL